MKKTFVFLLLAVLFTASFASANIYTEDLLYTAEQLELLDILNDGESALQPLQCEHVTYVLRDALPGDEWADETQYSQPDVLAYKIQYENGWTDWLVPGYNDVNSGQHEWEAFHSQTHLIAYCGEKFALDPTQRIMLWGGKVNQHTDEYGFWHTDPDGSSGGGYDRLEYCQKWYPETKTVRSYRKDTMPTWRQAGNTNYHTQPVWSYECISNPHKDEFYLQTYSEYSIYGLDFMATNNNPDNAVLKIAGEIYTLEEGETVQVSDVYVTVIENLYDRYDSYGAVTILVSDNPDETVSLNDDIVLDTMGAEKASCETTITSFEPTRNTISGDVYWENLHITDRHNPHQDIIAYRIEWSDDSWSDWITPGVNDLDNKYNWDGAQKSFHAYFQDYSFQVKHCADMIPSVIYQPEFQTIDWYYGDDSEADYNFFDWQGMSTLEYGILYGNPRSSLVAYTHEVIDWQERVSKVKVNEWDTQISKARITAIKYKESSIEVTVDTTNVDAPVTMLIVAAVEQDLFDGGQGVVAMIKEQGVVTCEGTFDGNSFTGIQTQLMDSIEEEASYLLEFSEFRMIECDTSAAEKKNSLISEGERNFFRRLFRR